MKIITVCGPASSGKTSVIRKAIISLGLPPSKIGVIKYDCLSALERSQYAGLGINIRVELAGDICPDHYFVSRLETNVRWGIDKNLSWLVIESAGLCNRCSPNIVGIPAVCVIDCLSGYHTPEKIGPMLNLADWIVITKGDIVSQAEREVFATKTEEMAPHSEILFINGLTGQGAGELAECFNEAAELDTVIGHSLRYCMPSGLCSYCSGKTRIGGR